jgi:ligand-binding sensor protein
MTHTVILQSWATEVNYLQSFTRRRQTQSEVKLGMLVASFGCVEKGGNEARGNQPYAYICDSV